MSETIKIIQPASTSFPIVQGERTADLLSRFTKLDNDERENLLNETTSILSQCNNPVETVGSTTGITIGYVQSGKTMSFTTLTALAIDNGFRIVIYFAGIKNNLLEQTTKRLKKDLLTESDNSRFFKVYQSPSIKTNGHNDIKGALKLNRKPAILITVLKHTKHISELTEIFKTIEVREALGNNGVMIIDDEADQASLNTYARKNSKSEDWEDDEFSSTYSNILELRTSLPNHSYIQYTATPQAPLLINIMDLLSPKFHVVLTPGKAYTGGKTFFEDNTDLIKTIPDLEVYHHKHNPLVECPQSLIEALQLFLMGTAIVVNIQEKENFLSMMIHADREQDASKKFYNWVSNIMDNWSNRLGLPDNDPSKIELVTEFYNNYEDAIKRIDNPPTFDEVMNEVSQVLLDTNLELVIQGSREIDWSNATSHILVGAEMLNRGYTVEGLAVSYMPRYSISKSNADTIQQRCRFFGYKRNYLDSCRVYLPLDSILEYRDYVEHEEIMRTILKENSLEAVEQLLILNGSMNPTRSNILSVDVVSHKLNGWRQMNALQHIDENISFVSDFISSHTFKDFKNFGTDDRNHRYVKLEIGKVIEFLKDFKIMNMPDALRKSSTIQYLRYLAEKKDIKEAYIFEMSYAYDISKSKGTSLIDSKGGLKLNNIFSGRSTSGKEIYPGDKGIRFEDSLCVQIHKIKVKHNSMQWDKKVLYTLGIYYPEDFAHSFVGVEK
ncbi:Z1 domain-containing protein [Flavobacterium sp.]|uniref:Z1 domain-containing protein n=1 Tax=Flavobacterium sp. TaxID=239 RepID=UPI0035B2B865